MKFMSVQHEQKGVCAKFHCEWIAMWKKPCAYFNQIRNSIEILQTGQAHDSNKVDHHLDSFHIFPEPIYMGSHYKNKTLVRLSYLSNGNS